MQETGSYTQLHLFDFAGLLFSVQFGQGGLVVRLHKPLQLSRRGRDSGTVQLLGNQGGPELPPAPAPCLRRGSTMRLLRHIV